MQGFAARKYNDCVEEEDVTDLDDTAALPAVMLPDAETATAESTDDASAAALLERLMQRIDSIEKKLTNIAGSLEKSSAASPGNARKSRSKRARRKVAAA